MEPIVELISEELLKGRSKSVRNLVRQAMAENVPTSEIIIDGLMSGLEQLGEQFKNNQIFVSELLVAVQAMNAGMNELEKAADAGSKQFEGLHIGKVVIGTVKGDLHEIGKNIVAMSLKSAGFDVYDLGKDVEARDFVEKAEEVSADIVCISATLTTTMPQIKEVVDRFVRAKIRDKYTIMVGGAPVTSAYVKLIGADAYSSDAIDAVNIAKKCLMDKNKL